MTILEYCKDKRKLLETVLICDDYPLSHAKRASVESKIAILDEIIGVIEESKTKKGEKS